MAQFTTARTYYLSMIPHDDHVCVLGQARFVQLFVQPFQEKVLTKTRDKTEESR